MIKKAKAISVKQQPNSDEALASIDVTKVVAFNSATNRYTIQLPVTPIPWDFPVFSPDFMEWMKRAGLGDGTFDACFEKVQDTVTKAQVLNALFEELDG